jgi:PIN domain-containing protein
VPSQEQGPPFAVVLDTNIWVHRTHLLRSGLGPSLVSVLATARAVLGLPAVVEREIRAHTYSVAMKKVEDAQAHSRLMGTTVPELPTKEQASNAVDRRLAELGSIERVPFTLAHAERALDRVFERTAPSDRSQQFKDAAIWEAVCELAARLPVHFVTDDKAFFEGHEPQKGTALSLQQEIATAANPSPYTTGSTRF